MDETVDWDESTDSWEWRHPPTTRADLLTEEEQFAADAEAESENRAWREERLYGRRSELERARPAPRLQGIWMTTPSASGDGFSGYWAADP